MKKKIVFDLDGVLRDIDNYLVDKYNVPYPTEWDWKYKGKDFWWYANKDNDMLVINSKPTEYLDTIKKYCKSLEIWTCQPERWRKNIKKWVYNNLGSNIKLFFLSTKEKRIRLDKETDTVLVEDNPNFTSYERILLIDRPYNKKVKTKNRIRNPKQLAKVLKEFK